MDDGDHDAGSLIQESLPCSLFSGLPPGLGLPDVYLNLLQTAPTADFYCFVDQDDIWEASKLRLATQALSRQGDLPALWVCRVAATRYPERPGVGRYLPQGMPRPSWRNALVENIAPGCAMVWNAALQRILARAGIPRGVIMHDWWLYAVASTVGTVLFEPAPLVRYRLHSGNAVGVKRDPATRLNRVLASKRPGHSSLPTQAQALIESFGTEMSPEQFRVTSELAGSARLAMVLNSAKGDVYRNSSLEYPLLVTRMLAL